MLYMLYAARNQKAHFDQGGAAEIRDRGPVEEESDVVSFLIYIYIYIIYYIYIYINIYIYIYIYSSFSHFCF